MEIADLVTPEGVIANLRVIREQGHEKSYTVVGGDSIKAYKCGAIIRIDIKEEK